MSRIAHTQVSIGHMIRVEHRDNDWCNVIGRQLGWLRLRARNDEEFSMLASQYPSYEVHEVTQEYALGLIRKEFGVVELIS